MSLSDAALHKISIFSTYCAKMQNAFQQRRMVDRLCLGHIALRKFSAVQY